MSPETNDVLVVIEGGPLSFIQTVNALKKDITITGLFNIKQENQRGYFSTAEFLYTVKSKLDRDPNLTREGVSAIYQSYCNTPGTFNWHDKNQDIKEKFEHAMNNDFIEQDLYEKLVTTHIEKCPEAT